MAAVKMMFFLDFGSANHEFKRGCPRPSVAISRLENPRFLEKSFKFLKKNFDFSVEIRLDTKFPHRKNIQYTIHSVFR